MLEISNPFQNVVSVWKFVAAVEYTFVSTYMNF